MACAGSKSNLRGYTCGLWTLAHTLTVEAYKNEQYNSAFKPVADVLEPFHQFIVLFLSCGECAENFDKETINHELDLVTRPEDVVIWLWRVHNFVNKRLSGSPSEDPKYPKQQFPPKKLCSHCYNETDFLDESKTFEFLKSYYSDIRQDTFKAVGSRHLNPKFAVHAEKVDKLEAAENRLRKELDASPQRQWRDIEGYDGYYGKNSGRGHLYVIWLSAIGIIIVFIYCKYRRNRSKFWKTFYYHNDFKLCPWSSDKPAKKYLA
uniref:Sulfhydryl oxidase n=1 Tax=Heterorhabditis bacteriophora TaxID=37862 RepID=A0A1I7XG14_HETBA